MRTVSRTGTDCGPTAKTSLDLTGISLENCTILTPIFELILKEH
jgi:hypothetical protein